MAMTVRDFLARRIRLEITDWQAAIETAPTVARLLGEIHGWSKAGQTQQTENYVQLIRQFQTNALFT
jgi:glycerol-3-phosphate dehydrogenase